MKQNVVTAGSVQQEFNNLIDSIESKQSSSYVLIASTKIQEEGFKKLFPGIPIIKAYDL